MYYLAREKQERERVYGPGQFASSQVSLQDAAGHATNNGPVPNVTGEDNVSYGTTKQPHYTVPIPAKKEAVTAGGKADYSMPLPRLPAPETSHYSDMSYDNTVRLLHLLPKPSIPSPVPEIPVCHHPRHPWRLPSDRWRLTRRRSLESFLVPHPPARIGGVII